MKHPCQHPLDLPHIYAKEIHQNSSKIWSFFPARTHTKGIETQLKIQPREVNDCDPIKNAAIGSSTTTLAQREGPWYALPNQDNLKANVGQADRSNASFDMGSIVWTKARRKLSGEGLQKTQGKELGRPGARGEILTDHWQL